MRVQLWDMAPIQMGQTILCPKSSLRWRIEMVCRFRSQIRFEIECCIHRFTCTSSTTEQVQASRVVEHRVRLETQRHNHSRTSELIRWWKWRVFPGRSLSLLKVYDFYFMVINMDDKMLYQIGCLIISFNLAVGAGGELDWHSHSLCSLPGSPLAGSSSD